MTDYPDLEQVETDMGVATVATRLLIQQALSRHGVQDINEDVVDDIARRVAEKFEGVMDTHLPVSPEEDARNIAAISAAFGGTAPAI